MQSVFVRSGRFELSPMYIRVSESACSDTPRTSWVVFFCSGGAQESGSVGAGACSVVFWSTRAAPPLVDEPVFFSCFTVPISFFLIHGAPQYHLVSRRKRDPSGACGGRVDDVKPASMMSTTRATWVLGTFIILQFHEEFL